MQLQIISNPVFWCVSENGLLSYENPNYHLVHEDQLNSNTEEDLLYYQHLYQELGQRTGAISQAADAILDKQSLGGSQAAPCRRGYKNLDIGSMGVDVTTGPHLEGAGPTTGPTTGPTEAHVDNR